MITTDNSALYKFQSVTVSGGAPFARQAKRRKKTFLPGPCRFRRHRPGQTESFLRCFFSKKRLLPVSPRSQIDNDVALGLAATDENIAIGRRFDRVWPVADSAVDQP